MIAWLLDLAWWLLDLALWFLLNVWRVALDQAKKRPAGVVVIALAIMRMFGTTVQTGTAGVLFSWGRARKVLEPGFHPLIPIVQLVRHTPVRSVTLDLPRQRIATGDGLVYDVDTTIVYRVEDPITAAVAIDSVRLGIVTLVPLLVHDLLREQTRETLTARQELDHELTVRARLALARWGLHIETAGMSTIAPTRPTVRLTQLSARVAERLRLLRETGETSIAIALTTAVQAPQGKPRARYRRHRAPAFKEAASARVTVVMPPGGKLTVNEVEMLATDQRTFDTPRLEREKPYYYTMKVDYLVHGIPAVETRVVEVRAGKVYTVDFTMPAPEPSVPNDN